MTECLGSEVWCPGNKKGAEHLDMVRMKLGKIVELEEE